MYVMHAKTHTKVLNAVLPSGKKKHKSDQTSDVRAASLSILFDRET